MQIIQNDHFTLTANTTDFKVIQSFPVIWKINVHVINQRPPA